MEHGRCRLLAALVATPLATACGGSELDSDLFGRSGAGGSGQLGGSGAGATGGTGAAGFSGAATGGARAGGTGGVVTGGTGGVAAGGTATGGAGGTVLPGQVIDNMDDCDDTIDPTDGREGSWYSFNSNCDFGVNGFGIQWPTESCSGQGEAFQMTPSGDGCEASTHGSGFPFSDPNWGYAGIGFDLASGLAFDACRYGGLRFTLSGTPVRLNVAITATTVDHDHFGVRASAGTNSVSWAQLTQEGWGTPQTFDCSRLIALQFQAEDPTSFDFAVDNIEFVTGT